MALQDDELPVLNEVVRTGDETIIRSTRLQRVEIEELDLTSTGSLHFELPPHLQFDILGSDEDDHESNVPDHVLPMNSRFDSDRLGDTQAVEPIIDSPSEAALETLIDEIIDNHIISLRKDLRRLLQRARDLP